MTTAVRDTNPALQQTSLHHPLPTAVSGHPKNCNCLECCDLAAAWARRRARMIGYGTWQPWASAAPVRAHIEAVHASGIAYRQIARLAGMTLWDVHQIRTNRDKIRPATAARLMAVRAATSALDPKAFIPARSTQRRLQGLRAIGWPAVELSRRTGLGLDSMTRIHTSSYVWASTHLTFTDVYDDLHDQDPVRHGVERWISQRGINHARKRGWAVPTAWTDIDTDQSPNPRRIVPVYALRGDRSQDVIDDTAELALLGADRAEISERLVLDWDSISAAHRRAGVDLPPGVRGQTPARADPG
jgi:hypothetical protein